MWTNFKLNQVRTQQNDKAQMKQTITSDTNVCTHFYESAVQRDILRWADPPFKESYQTPIKEVSAF